MAELISTCLWKALNCLFLDRIRDKAADALDTGDAIHEEIRKRIEREFNVLNEKLEALGRRDLKTSISYFQQGVSHLFELLDKARVEENGSLTAGTTLRLEKGNVSEVSAGGKTVSIVKNMKNLSLHDLDHVDKKTLKKAQDEFKFASRKATEAFHSEKIIKTLERIKAMLIRVAATILESIDNPTNALTTCRLCLEELHSMPAVRTSFSNLFKKRLWPFGGKERDEIITTVYGVNRIIWDVTQTFCLGNRNWFSDWPCVEFEGEKLNPLNDSRVAYTLREMGVEYIYPSWSFGQEGEEGYKLQFPVGIATCSNGGFIVADQEDKNVKVFDSNGNFLRSFCPPNDDGNAKVSIDDVATDRSDNIYVLVELKRKVSVVLESSEWEIYVFGKARNLDCKFPLNTGIWYCSLTVTDSNKVLVVGESDGGKRNVIHLYKTDGKLVRSFGDRLLSHVTAIAKAYDGHFVVVDGTYSRFRVFVVDERDKILLMFKLETEGYYFLFPKIAFDRERENFVIAAKGKILIYTKHGQFVRGTEIVAQQIQGIAVSGGCTALACSERKEIIVLNV